jgi:Flp pilus assembly protein TadD
VKATTESQPAFRCLIGGARADREAHARDLARATARPLVTTAAVAGWPFQRDILPPHPGPCAVLLPDLDLAFPAGQRPGTRLVLTQSTYQLQRWLDWLAAAPGRAVIAHAGREALRRGAAEAFAKRGPWSRIAVVPLDGDEAGGSPGAGVARLHEAFAAGAPEDRLRVCREAGREQPGNPALRLATASAHMEVEETDAAQRLLDLAVAAAPDWEAVWFEYGKLWLRGDDLERAADRFAEAARLMPSFAAALTNLGAALAETERPEEAIAALQQALALDPNGHQILNNIAVIHREQGRLDEAVEAGRCLVALAPDFVFGRYNLAHALFLQGRFGDARDTYQEALARDPQKNVVQALRAVVATAAAGDLSSAADLLEQTADRIPGEQRRSALEEPEEVLAALAELDSTQRDALAPLRNRVLELRR